MILLYPGPKCTFYLYPDRYLLQYKTETNLNANMYAGLMRTRKEDKKPTLTAVIESELEILERHIEILDLVMRNEPIGIIKLSEMTGYPQHMIRYSLHILEQEGIIEPSPRGAVTTRRLKSAIENLKKSLANINKKIEDIMDKLS